MYVPFLQSLKKQTSDSVFEAVGVNSVHELLSKYRSLEEWSIVMRQAGLQSSNLIFGSGQMVWNVR
jgi:hypothetical protein